MISEENIPSLAALLPDNVEDPFGTRHLLEKEFRLSCLLDTAGVDLDPDGHYHSTPSS